MKLADLVVLEDESVGKGGFLHVRRLTLKNRRDDESLSRAYTCDFVERPMGTDAVAVVVHRRGTEGVEVLLRACLRPSMHFGRDDGTGFQSSEVVAGIVERHDLGESGLLQRACDEVWEEAGFRVLPGRVVSLGAASFPSVGIIAEKIHLTCVEVPADAVPEVAAGDGSPMEEGGALEWIDIDEAIACCVSGRIADMKTEVALRRLRDTLA